MENWSQLMPAMNRSLTIPVIVKNAIQGSGVAIKARRGSDCMPEARYSSQAVEPGAFSNGINAPARKGRF